MNFNIAESAKGVAVVAGKLYHTVKGTPAEKDEREKLIDSINIARNELMQAESYFNELTDEAALDYAAYNIMAARSRYSYLIAVAKKANITFD